MAETTPATVWRPSSGEGEFTAGSVNNIADSTNNQLVDSSGTFVVDSGGIFTPTSATTWTQNNGS